jgi:transposase-like protein
MTKQDRQKQYFETIRTWKKFNPKVGRGIRIKERDKIAAVWLAKAAGVIGETSGSTAKRLGITPNTLSTWTKKFPSPNIPITPDKPVASALSTLTMPSGARVEGLTTTQLAAILKELG